MSIYEEADRYAEGDLDEYQAYMDAEEELAEARADEEREG